MGQALMGCLNSKGNFSRWFANVHLSGPCNRACYFCIGQHMMALDALNTLDRWPLPGIELFVERCLEQGISEVNVTGTNTEPLLYRHTPALRTYLEERIPGLLLGVRSNGVLTTARPDIWRLYDKASVTLCSADPVVYRAMMGRGSPPDLRAIMAASQHMRDVKVNIVLGPENTQGDLWRTLDHISAVGDPKLRRVNLREPYGQRHIGDPLAAAGHAPLRTHLGMPVYAWGGLEVTYWDVHYVEVESVNLYANGNVSLTYPVTRGHIPNDGGEVRPQSEFPGGRVREQWLAYRTRRAAGEQDDHAQGRA